MRTPVNHRFEAAPLQAAPDPALHRVGSPCGTAFVVRVRGSAAAAGWLRFGALAAGAALARWRRRRPRRRRCRRLAPAAAGSAGTDETIAGGGGLVSHG